MTPLDLDWLQRHPLPQPDAVTDKNERGRVLVVGGGCFVPGALRLTGEAALRAGAGKLQLGTVAEAALSLGMMVPEAGVISLPSRADGELGLGAAEALSDALTSCDALVLGPAMKDSDECGPLVAQLIGTLASGVAAVLDAAAIPASRTCADVIRRHGGPMLLTPHHGEMAALMQRDADWIAAHAEQAAAEVAADLDAVVILKSARTIIASPGQEPLIFEGGGPGLATGGSGDVLAGVLGGLLARGAEPLTAAGWAVKVHGEAGRRLSERFGGLGLLARELVDLIPGLLNRAAE